MNYEKEYFAYYGCSRRAGRASHQCTWKCLATIHVSPVSPVDGHRTPGPELWIGRLPQAVHVPLPNVPRPDKRQWLGFIVSQLYGKNRDWAEYLARSGSSALNNVTQFVELFMKESRTHKRLHKRARAELQPETHKVVSLAKLQPEVIMATSYPELQSEIHEVVSPAELQPEVNVATSSTELQPETHEIVSSAELQPEVNVATSSAELQPETHEVVSPAELQPELNVAASSPELQHEIHEVVSSTELQHETHEVVSALEPQLTSTWRPHLQSSNLRPTR
ncbi:uncharacterized protein LOC128607448 isoform X1 [Ictalurus furcatus]|uniref:uncharacterized protein LOC128607448 isoform X1 n=2 Tax=Ictalurus furcatus TaxID=66913 RepID=UPI0023505293|nr:uncharacterized protein LOC128607448 isoform X1 [Ictalurus furcatus]